MMPVGGDVTQFFLGLMGTLSVALREGRLPVWNELWGYGFPGLGESQMGVYYPPHLILYGILPTERAYVASLVLHTLVGAIGGWWAARQFGVSQLGSGLAGFVYASCGFFLIHMPHPWGYTTGSWMPWAWGLAWLILTSRSERQAGRMLLLSLVLVFQILPGHFQVAFMTMAGIALLSLWGVLEPMLRQTMPAAVQPGRTMSQGLWRVLALLLCLAMVFPLGALQLWPTARLARLAAAQRDFNYLSGFAASPLHLVNYVAPRLFHHSPLWRPLVWDPFHTSPEEMLAYVGLVPLFLALLAVFHEIRRDRAVRALAVLAVVTLILSLGPYAPGFRFLIGMPGFSFFRAPARWSLATSLALAILAGKGLDRCCIWPRPGRALGWMAVGSGGWIVLVLAVLELAMASGASQSDGGLSGVFERAFRARPWTDDPGFQSVRAQARQPAGDPRVPAVLARALSNTSGEQPKSFLEIRGQIYFRELAGTACLLGAVLGVSWLTSLRGRSGHLPAALVILTAFDLLLQGSDRLVEVGPMRALAEQSPVLERLTQEPRGARVVDHFRNLPMLVGLEPISAYRTLDLPALEPLGELASGPLRSAASRGRVHKAMRATGVGVRVLDPVEVAMEGLLTRSERTGDPETIDDPVLAGWLFGPSWIARQGSWASRFRIYHPKTEPHRAWFVPLTALSHLNMLDHWDGDTGPLLALFDRAVPLRENRRASTLLDIEIEAEEPGWVIITQLADPQWQARWVDEAGEELPARILPSFLRKLSDGGWQRVELPGPGRWSLHMEYVARDVRDGLAISALAWALWCLAAVVAAIQSIRRGTA
ncbi:MAG TPA: hypothetical protein VJY33_10030 [Isosphaeraceae bacterium]|nr:hypothetical protein [Isosphaeraceae bacterium]